MSALERFDDDPDAGDPVIADALTALIRQEIAFITETNNLGETQYVIDRVRFKADEIRRLQEQGALTRDGIRRYLVSR